ncbi:MAG: ABC transporter ATP-binding protein [Thermoproteota archaeon]
MAHHYHFHGIEAEGRPKEVASSVLIRWLLSQLSPMKFSIILLVATTLTTLVLNMVGPYLSKLIVDEGIVRRDVEALFRYSLMLMAVAGASFILGVLRNYLTGRINQLFLYGMRDKVFKHLEEMDVSYVSGERTGRIISLITNDIEAIGDVATSGTMEVFVGALTIIGTIYVMVGFNLMLSLATFSIVPLMVLVSRYFARKTREAYRLTREKISELTSNVEQGVSGSKVSQSFVERREVDSREFRRVSNETMGANIRARFIFSLVNPSLNAIRASSLAILIIYGGSLAASGIMSVGTLIAFYSYTEMFFRPIITFTTFYSTVQAALAASERVYIFLATKPTVVELEFARDIDIKRGAIMFDDVTFSYGDSEVFKGLKMIIRPAEVVAIVGPTGAGKTTITNLIMRLYDPLSGKILIDGHDIKEFKYESLRSQISLVPQEPILFNDTIINNICMGRRDSSDEDVMQTVSELGLSDMVASLPEGFNTVVSPGGSNLSVGQRQLISLARAMLKDPKILILDEATSSLDPYTESILQKAMVRIMMGRTCILIAHRLSTVKLASRVIVLSNGKIVEEGSHEELLSRGGMYRSLYELQFGIVPQKIQELKRL